MNTGLMSRIPAVICFCVLALVSARPAFAIEPETLLDIAQREFKRPDTIPFPENAPYNREIATLGKMLFFDPRLSGSQNMSCVTCHNPSFGWETPVDRAIGAMNQPLSRHAPTVLNAAWVEPFFWDGRAATLEEQAEGPITAKMEMNATFQDIKTRLEAVPEYRMHFARLFPETGISQHSITRSLAMYQRTIVSGRAPFDRWIEGEVDAISDAAKRGFGLFIGDAQCVVCHTGWNFSGNGFFDVGLASDPTEDGAAEEPVHFKTSGLRNIALRAPYMHDGSLATLQDVIRHYAIGGLPSNAREPDIVPLVLTPENEAEIIAFLETLTEERTNVRTPVLPTQ